MSNPASSPGNPIPTAVLVTAQEKARKGPKARYKRGKDLAQLPWLKIAIGATAAWMLVLVGLALTTTLQERSQKQKGMAVPLVQAKNAPVIAPELAPVAEPLFGPAQPKVAELPPPGDLREDFGAFQPQPECNVLVAPDQLGTQVHLLKDPPEAFKKARAENKMVFMIHLSGNLEDKQFT